MKQKLKNTRTHTIMNRFCSTAILYKEKCTLKKKPKTVSKIFKKTIAYHTQKKVYRMFSTLSLYKS